MPSILIINPNSSTQMTDSLKAIVPQTDKDTTHTYFTAPLPSPASINNDDDAAASLQALIPALTPAVLASHDAFLVACYSGHPLEPWLKAQPAISESDKPVLGIVGASVLRAVELLDRPGTQADTMFGIVSTGIVWEWLLPYAVKGFLRSRGVEGEMRRFAGVKSTGLSAGELHEVDRAEVDGRMREAAGELVGDGDVGVVCLGCAGMVGMEKAVRAGCVGVLGEERGGKVEVVDGVIAGVEILEKWLRERGTEGK